MNLLTFTLLLRNAPFHACYYYCCVLYFSCSHKDRFRKDAILKLMGLTDSFTWDESPAKDCHTGKTSKGSLIPVIKNSVWKLCLFVIAFHGSYFTLQVSLGRRILSINSYYPFDWTVSPLYELVNITQFVAASVYVCTIFGFLGLYATFTCIACTQLEKLRANIYNIRQKHDTTEQDSGAETDQEEEGKVYTTQQMFCHMQKQLNDCIRHHQEILKFMWELEKTMNPMLVVQFVIILAGLCLSAFSLVTNMGDVLQMAQALLIYFGFMTEVCCICWFGDELTEEAESIRDAAWGCDWVGTPVTFQRCILFIIVAANKKFELTAGKIVGVSNNTMANIFNQTLSYLTFLIQAKDNID
ncbi:odorant receptor 2a-like isoform X2 [Zootermopsis nevadensis]|uniref:odorant receptor 2a-like isoform X2 n=1 Tax=Zootermopsis nevadensis TaxID=136037 RepID=UPI000B8E2BF9|nr:odorant receptor 2a-like isoform X2 [Zootermopsis nevadensis]